MKKVSFSFHLIIITLKKENNDIEKRNQKDEDQTKLKMDLIKKGILQKVQEQTSKLLNLQRLKRSQKKTILFCGEKKRFKYINNKILHLFLFRLMNHLF